MIKTLNTLKLFYRRSQDLHRRYSLIHSEDGRIKDQPYTALVEAISADPRRVIVDEALGLINYHLIEISSS